MAGTGNEAVMLRVDRVRSALQERGLKALVVFSAPQGTGAASVTSGTVRYLTNWAQPFTSQPSLLVLPLDGDPVLFVHAFFGRRYAEEQGIWVRDVRTDSPYSSGANARGVLEERIGSGRVGVIGRAEMPVRMYLQLTVPPGAWTFEDADDLLTAARMIKGPEEIELHRAAAQISDVMLYAGMNSARVPGKWAYELMAEMEYVGRLMGADYSHLWLEAGPVPDFQYRQVWQLRRQLHDGDRVQAGTYVIYQGYWGHELRMAVKGKPGRDLKRYFDRIVEVQDAGLRELRPGRRLGDVALVMERLIADYSPHAREEDPVAFSLGHGLGLHYAEPLVSDTFPQPWPDSDSNRPRTEEGDRLLVQPGMVLELHPNFSVPGLGQFVIGDMVLVTESGPEMLTKFPRELYEV